MPRHFSLEGREHPSPAVHDGNPLFLDASQVILDGLVAGEVLHEGVLVQVRLETEDLLCYFLVLPLDPLQLSLPLVEMQALRFEFNARDGVALAEDGLRGVDRYGLLACRDLHELLEQLLVVPLNLRLFH